MNEKKTQVVAVRLTPETKAFLQDESEKLQWSISKLIENIIKEWIKDAKGKNGAMQFIINQQGEININNN